MRTFENLKLKIEKDVSLGCDILSSAENEILIDLDHDGMADIALLYTAGDGDIEFLAVDTDGDGELDIYVGDTDEKGIPLVKMRDADGPVISPDDPLLPLIAAASLVRSAIITGDYIHDTLSAKLVSLEHEIKHIRKTKRSENIL